MTDIKNQEVNFQAFDATAMMLEWSTAAAQLFKKDSRKQVLDAAEHENQNCFFCAEDKDSKMYTLFFGEKLI